MQTLDLFSLHLDHPNLTTPPPTTAPKSLLPKPPEAWLVSASFHVHFRNSRTDYAVTEAETGRWSSIRDRLIFHLYHHCRPSSRSETPITSVPDSFKTGESGGVVVVPPRATSQPPHSASPISCIRLILRSDIRYHNPAANTVCPDNKAGSRICVLSSRQISAPCVHCSTSKVC